MAKDGEEKVSPVFKKLQVLTHSHNDSHYKK